MFFFVMKKMVSTLAFVSNFILSILNLPSIKMIFVAQRVANFSKLTGQIRKFRAKLKNEDLIELNTM